MGANSVTFKVFSAQLAWDETEAIYYNSMINSLGILGAAAGFLLSGGLIKKGRRRAGLFANLMIILSSLLMMHLSLSTLLVGRVIFGFFSGILGTVTTKSVAENMPDKASSKYGMAFNSACCFGILVCFLLGFMIPTAEAELLVDQRWRIIFLMPCVFATLQIILYLVYIKEEPYMFCISTGRDEEGKRMIRRVFKAGAGVNLDEAQMRALTDEMYDLEKASTSIGDSEVTYG